MKTLCFILAMCSCLMGYAGGGAASSDGDLFWIMLALLAILLIFFVAHRIYKFIRARKGL